MAPIAHYQPLAIVGQSPALGRIGKGAQQGKIGQVVDETRVLLPGQLYKPVFP